MHHTTEIRAPPLFQLGKSYKSKRFSCPSPLSSWAGALPHMSIGEGFGDPASSLPITTLIGWIFITRVSEPFLSLDCFAKAWVFFLPRKIDYKKIFSFWEPLTGPLGWFHPSPTAYARTLGIFRMFSIFSRKLPHFDGQFCFNVLIKSKLTFQKQAKL